MSLSPERIAELRAMLASVRACKAHVNSPAGRAADIEQFTENVRAWAEHEKDLVGALLHDADALLASADEAARLRGRVADLEQMVEAGPVPPACSVEDWASAHLENARLREQLDAAAPPPEPAPKCEWCGRDGVCDALTCGDPNWGRRCVCGVALPSGARHAHACQHTEPAPSESAEARIAEWLESAMCCAGLGETMARIVPVPHLEAGARLMRELAAGAAEAKAALHQRSEAFSRIENRNAAIIADLRQKLAAAESDRNAIAVDAQAHLEVWDHATRNDWTPCDLRAHQTAATTLRKRLAALRAQQPTPAAEKPEAGGPKSPQYEPAGWHQTVAYLVEECGEAIAAAGKTLRWGMHSYNPELPPERRETNIAWLLREIADVEAGIARVRALAKGDR